MTRAHTSPVLVLLVATFAASLVAAGCAGGGRTAQPAGPASLQDGVASAPAPLVLERPVPNPVPVSRAFARAVERGTRTTTGLPGPRYWRQEADYAMTVRLRPDERRLEGRARIVYRNNSPDTLAALHLELVQNVHREGAVRNDAAEVTGGLVLGRVAVGGQVITERSGNLPPRYAVHGTHLAIVPPRPVMPGAAIEIETDWSFRIPQAGAAGRMGYAGDDVFFLAYWYPVMAVYDDVEGWVTDPFLGEGEFYSDFASYDVTVEAPPGWIVWGTGALRNASEVLAPGVLARLERAVASDTPVRVVGPDDFGRATAEAGGDDGLLRWRFTADAVRDFAFAATRASVWEAARTRIGDRDGDGADDYAAVHTFYRPAARRWVEVTRYQQHALTFLSEHAAYPYPWPHMSAVEGAGIIGGGMEYPMMTLIGDYTHAGDAALYSVTAHELAHQWIPMIVNTNERRYGWLDEGLTMFAENQAEKAYAADSFYYDLEDQHVYLAAARQEMEGPMMRRTDYQYPGPAGVVASYMKPSAVLAALRAMLGDEVFYEAFHAFVETWAYKHAYPADFFNTFERVSGRDLGWFWRTWYYETWLLDQSVADVRTAGEATEIVVEDQGDAPMPVDLVVTLASGEVLRREIPVDVWLAGRRRAVLALTTDAPVARVEIDPEHDFPDADRSNNAWEHD